MGIGCGEQGKIIVTDQDEIAQSNLHRQFLYRQTDVGRNKAAVASLASKSINPQMKIECHQLEVSEKTEQVFNTIFWEGLDEIVSAVDNVKAREYLNQKSHFYDKPLLNSGTKGLSCSTSVILPFRTEEFQT